MYTKEYFKNFSKKELIRHGFIQFEPGFWLIPGSFYNKIKDGEKFNCINGKEIIFKKGITCDDVRYGMLAYGFKKDI